MSTKISGDTGVDKVLSAAVVPYDNTASGLAATNVQEAVDQTAITLGTAVTLSGQTFVDFAIPVGVKRVTVILAEVSTNGTGNYAINIGTGGVLSFTGYTSGVSNQAGTMSNSVGNFIITSGGTSASLFKGIVDLHSLGAEDVWVYTSTIYESQTGSLRYSSGLKNLEGPLDILRLTTGPGADQFDAGIVNVSWEF